MPPSRGTVGELRGRCESLRFLLGASFVDFFACRWAWFSRERITVQSDFSYGPRIIWPGMVFEPIIYSLKHCFGSFARNNTPKADPLFGAEKHSRVTINVA